MTVAEEDAPVASVCVNHPRRETAVRCGKCGNYLCPKCMVQTPVGVRCRTCAQFRRLPQFDVGPWLLARATIVGLVVSAITWFLVTFIPFLLFFLGIAVGLAVGESMSRLARRRTSRPLEVAAVFDVVLGLGVVLALRTNGEILHVLTGTAGSPRVLLTTLIPAVIASFVAVVKLR